MRPGGNSSIAAVRAYRGCGRSCRELQVDRSVGVRWTITEVASSMFLPTMNTPRPRMWRPWSGRGPSSTRSGDGNASSRVGGSASCSSPAVPGHGSVAT